MSMIQVKVGNDQIALNKNELKEAARLGDFVRLYPSMAQKEWDIWARSAPTAAAKERRKAVARALGLSDEIKFL